MLIGFAPVVGWILVFIECGCGKGRSVKNEYGLPSQYFHNVSKATSCLGMGLIVLVLLYLYMPIRFHEDGWFQRGGGNELESSVIDRPKGQSKKVDSFKDCESCPEMIRLPAGQFMMGTDKGMAFHYENQAPRHKVVIERAFAIGKYEITFFEYDACVADGGCTYKPDSGEWGRGRQPVINVHWGDAQQYVVWLSNKTGEEYLLPSEEEWEYAARSGSDSAFWWGNKPRENYINCNGCLSGVSRVGLAPYPVGSFKENNFGLFDILGNVYEWTSSCLQLVGGEVLLYDVKKTVDTKSCRSRVIRGGTYLLGHGFATSSRRLGGRVDYENTHGTGYYSRNERIGFRVARNL